MVAVCSIQGVDVAEILSPVLVDVSGAVGSAGAVDQRPEHRRQHHHGEEHVHRVAHRLTRCQIHRHHSDGRDQHGDRQQTGERIHRRRRRYLRGCLRRRRGRMLSAAPALVPLGQSPSNYRRRRRGSGSSAPSPAGQVAAIAFPRVELRLARGRVEGGPMPDSLCRFTVAACVEDAHRAVDLARRPTWKSASFCRRSSTSLRQQDI